MGKRRKGHKQVVETFDSDDERAYQNEARPDPGADDFFQDEIDEFHSSRDKVLLDRGHKKLTPEIEEDQEKEVYGLLSDDSDDEEIQSYEKQLKRIREITKKHEPDSDAEETEQGDGLPDSRAWGTRRYKYYGADVEDDIELEGSSDEEGAALLEEKEALAMQKKMAEELDEQDFGLEIFQQKEKKEDLTKPEAKIVKDLSKMSKKEKLALLKKQSPEFLTLIDDYKEKMKEVEKLLPLQKLCQEKNLAKNAALYVDSKIQLNLNYCINISFYMVLKSKQIAVHQHPVINRLVQYRNLMKQMEPVDEQIKPELERILKMIEDGEDIEVAEKSSSVAEFKRRKPKGILKQNEEKKRLSELIASDSESDVDEVPVKQKRKKKEDGQYETKDEKAALEYYKMMRKKGHDSDDEEQEEFDANLDEELPDEARENPEDRGEEETGDGKRGITYEIAKNKGLTAKKKKELRNPRVKHRMKFRKALIRRKGAVREVRREITPYGGELSGIRASIKRSVKLH